MIWIQICKMIIFFTSNTITPFTLTFLQTAMRAISLQKVHLWMEISAGCPNRGRRSLTKMDRLRNVQSSVWTLQQILPACSSCSLRATGFIYHDFLQKLYTVILHYGNWSYFIIYVQIWCAVQPKPNKQQPAVYEKATNGKFFCASDKIGRAHLNSSHTS